MPNSKTPILYSFRRCPYAIRARLALSNANICIELREVILRDKPAQLLKISPKATVPVLQLADDRIMDESLDIMRWALSKKDKNNWLNEGNLNEIQLLIQWNDQRFKYFLDRYKYADRYPENSALFYRENAEAFIVELESRLSRQTFLCEDHCTLADIAIFPFIRQFANVDQGWFQNSNYQHLNLWLTKHLNSELFIAVMKKYPQWKAENHDTPVTFMNA